MTLPNRANYTPGEKRRARKYQAPPESVRPMRSKMAIQGKGGHEDDALREELLQVLSAMTSDSAGSSTASAMKFKAGPQYHLKMMAECKAQAESARQRLFADPCYQQLPGKEETMGFTALLEGGVNQMPSESDPLEQLLTGMAADTGLPQTSASRGKANHRLDPQWVSLFQQAGVERQQLVDGLNKLENPNHGTMSDLDAAMDTMQDAPMRGKYQRSLRNLKDWGKHRLYQQLRASILSDRGDGGDSFGSSSPSSPMESPLRQPPKKRTNLSKHAKSILRTWFEQHMHHPYPNEEEKDWLSAHGGITIDQVNNWFINTRGRKWKPMLARMIRDKNLGVESKMLDRLVQKIEEPYRHMSN